MKMLSGLCFAIALCVPAAALAQTPPLYKLVDKNGKVTYAEKVPPGWEGQATRVDIDTQRNTATLPKAGSASVEGGESTRAKPVSSPAKEAAARKERRVEAAKQKLESAKSSLADALANPSDDDVMRVGNARAGGGATSRAVWSDAYRSRIEGLERGVKDAEAALAEAEASD